MNLLHTAHVPEGDGPFTTVLALHGYGASAHDLLGIARFLHGGRILMLAPQGPIAVPIGPSLEGHGWFPIARGGPIDLREFAAAAVALDAFIDSAVRNYPVDPRKLVVAGFSQGGVLAYESFLRRPERFAALVALSSWLPDALAHALPELPEAKTRPVLVMHGTRDPTIAVERARESRARLLERRLQLTYREYEMGHEISPEALRDLVQWLEDKVFSPIRVP